MLSGKFPQISASDYLGTEKKPCALSPSQRAFSLMANTIFSKGQIDSRKVGLCYKLFSNGRAITLLDAQKQKMPAFRGIFSSIPKNTKYWANDSVAQRTKWFGVVN
jgi:hypothetical protein